MNDDVSENLPQNVKDEKMTLQGGLSKDLLEKLEKLESDLIKHRNSREKAVSTDESTNQQRRSISPNRKCANIIEEIKSTENSYVTKLKGHIAVYNYTIKNHEFEEIKKDSIKVVNNLTDLLQLQVKFANTLNSTNELEEVLKLFYQNKLLFQQYKSFFMNDQKFHSIQIEASSSKDEQIIDISLGAFLFQRLVQYKNLFEALQRVTAGLATKLIGKTLGVISDILNECNKKLVLERINLDPINKSESNLRGTVLIGNCPLDHYNEYGTYYMENQFIEAGKTVKMYLFSKVILVTKSQENNGQNIYQKHIKMTDVRLGPKKKNSKILVLEDFKKFKKTGILITYEFEASFEETCTEWRTKIEEILQRQLHTWKSVVEWKTRHLN